VYFNFTDQVLDTIGTINNCTEWHHVARIVLYQYRTWWYRDMHYLERQTILVHTFLNGRQQRLKQYIIIVYV